MYVDDYDGHSLSSYIYPAGWRVCPHYIWPDMLQPYIKNWNIFACPSGVQSIYVDEGARNCAAIGTQPYWGTIAKPLKLTYVYNEGWIDGTLPAGASPTVPYLLPGYNGMISAGTDDADLGVHEAAIEDPAGTIMVTDGIPTTTTGTSAVVVFRIIRDADWGTSPKAIRRHVDGVNCLFADGHVKFARQTTFGMWTRQGGD
jgi:prepilin-type processing-associated H-X9-DG protein